jgi:hypothetical protein
LSNIRSIYSRKNVKSSFLIVLQSFAEMIASVIPIQMKQIHDNNTFTSQQIANLTWPSATLVSGVAGKCIPVSNRAIERKVGILHEQAQTSQFSSQIEPGGCSSVLSERELYIFLMLNEFTFKIERYIVEGSLELLSD